MSSGERKRMMTKPLPWDTRRGLRQGGCGSSCPGADVPGFSDKTVREGNRIGCRAVEGDGPVPVGAWSVDRMSQVARASWNPV